MSPLSGRASGPIPPTSENTSLPRNLSAAISYFSSPARCLQFLSERRWPDGQIHCPVCGRTDIRVIATRNLWECKARHAGAQFSVKIGTIFEDSHIALKSWLIAIWLLANSNRRISSYQLARELGITQKSAWFMLHRIQAALDLRGIHLRSLGSAAAAMAHSGHAGQIS